MKSICGTRRMTISGLIAPRSFQGKVVTPAKAGVQGKRRIVATLDSRFRGNDDGGGRHSGIAFGFNCRTQVTICSRVTRIAEKSEVRTPMLRVTANPFTGPDPSQ